jgi:hypothetical protein
MLPTTNSMTLAHALCDQRHCTTSSCPSSSTFAETSLLLLVVSFISRINGDSTFSVTFQDGAVVDLIDNYTLLDLLKDRRVPAVTVTDGSKEAESDCDDGSDYDESNCDAEDGGRRRRLMRLRTPALKEPKYHVSPSP